MKSLFHSMYCTWQQDLLAPLSDSRTSILQDEVASKPNVAVVTLTGTIISGWNKGNPQAPNIASGWLVKVLQVSRLC